MSVSKPSLDFLRTLVLLLTTVSVLVRVAPANPTPPKAVMEAAGDVQQKVSSENSASSNPLITYQVGELPIILSAPHGGRDTVKDVVPRLGEGVKRFNSKSDSNTDQLTEMLADSMEEKLGQRPYVVIARFHRKYVDANRSRLLAYESKDAKATYDAYHLALTEARQEVIERWGRGILLDIHGQAAEPHAIIRGTQNGKTTSHLLSRFGQEALRGQTSLFGRLAEQGFRVIPPVDSSAREHDNYDGGHIVVKYGSGSGGTLDAIQLELGKDFRSSSALPTTADDLADAAIAFARDYLPAKELSRNSKPKATVRVGVYVDEGAGKSVNDLLRELSQLDQVAIAKLTADEIRSGKLSGLDLLFQPGGSGGGQGRKLGDTGRQEIRDFVREGGGYIGICAGAYLASSHYKWSLNILDAKVLDTQHWNRGNGSVEIAFTGAGRETLRSQKEKLSIHYGQGPLLAPGNRPEIDDYEILATYESEIVKNGAPTGVMKGTTAIASGHYGRGRVICFSPHPEKTPGLESMIRFAIEHVQRKSPR